MPVFNKKWSLESLAGYAEQVEAGLDAIEQGKPFVARWSDFIVQIESATTARNAARRVLRRARARVRVLDARFDAALVELSGAAFAASGKDENESPYAELFGATEANDVVDWGVVKATVYGRKLLPQVKTFDHPKLNPHIEPLSAAIEALAEAGDVVDGAEGALGSHDIHRVKLLAEMEAASIEGELDLAKALLKVPGRRELVRAVFAVEREEPKKKKDAAKPAQG